MCWLAEMIPDCESKWNGSWRKQDILVKGAESVYNIYFVKYGFRFGLKSIWAPYIGIFESSK